MRPARAFTSHHRQRNFPGLWWSATTGGHVGYQSWRQRDQLMLLDFDPAVVAVASQPFQLHWHDAADRPHSHAPSYFARRADGRGVVVDCHPAARAKPRNDAGFEAARRACELVGWEYRLVDPPDPVTTANVRWLAGYRHPRHHAPATADALRHAFTQPTPLLAGAHTVGDPIAVLPVLYHLLWRQELTCNLRVRLHEATPVTAADPR